MLDLLMKRRSIRKYKDMEIEDGVLDKLLQGALTSPSSKNRKPWELIVVKDKSILEKLGDTRGSSSGPLKNAPVGIVILGDPEASEIWIEDCSIISTVIQLLAEDLGLGSCWIQVRSRVNDKNENVEDLVKGILNIPEKYEVECMISIGYPNEEKSTHSKEGLSYNKIHDNGF
ncbi:nitroreductase family protein [Tissierella sp.]|uniref:nitroreductase family protein n=1 Tax=Tissierella sp. TaxID=41274 RepID=UPI00285AFF49|nr:nitroreductase family protein [Tissierella sp.]MDR7855639.1 nitroreductase family protein [Tissierella sp.]